MSWVGFLLLILVLMYATKNFPGAIGSLVKGTLIIFGLLAVLIFLLVVFF